MVKPKLNLKLNYNKSNGQFNISLPLKKLKKIDLKTFKRIKISIDGFE